MSKNKAIVDMVSYGIYQSWDRKTVPKLSKFTTDIPVGLSCEFGYLLRIQKARGAKIDFTMHHPRFLDESGRRAAPFHGELYVKNNDYRFFLGDTFWEPLADKVGLWELVTRLDGLEVARKTFNMYLEEDSED